MPSTKVTKTETEIETDDGTRTVVQHRMTVPKGVAEALDMAGDSWDWSIKSGDRLELACNDD